MTPYEHVQTYGLPTDRCTGKSLQTDCLLESAGFTLLLSAATSSSNPTWVAEIRAAMTANSNVAAQLSAAFGPATAQQRREVVDTLENADRCNRPRGVRYTPRYR